MLTWITRYKSNGTRRLFICWNRCMRWMRKCKCDAISMDSSWIVYILFSWLKLFHANIHLPAFFPQSEEGLSACKYLFNPCISLHKTWKLFESFNVLNCKCWLRWQNQCWICNRIKSEAVKSFAHNFNKQQLYLKLDSHSRCAVWQILQCGILLSWSAELLLNKWVDSKEN